MAIPQPEPHDWIRANAQELAVTDREVLAMLRDASKAVNKELADLVARDSPLISAGVRRAQLEQTRSRLLAKQGEIFERLGDIISARRAHAAARSQRLSAAADAALLALVGKGAEAQYLYEAALHASQRAIDTAIARMKLSALPLSRRIYQSNLWMNGRLGKLINETLAVGLNARTFVKKARDWFNPNTPGGVRFAAMRLARTEINNAFHAMSAQKYAETPWIRKVEWNLSGSHPKPDECNALADASPYETDETPARPHPQCMCYITPISEDEDDFVENFLKGDYDEYLDAELEAKGWDVKDPVPAPVAAPPPPAPVRRTDDRLITALKVDQEYSNDLVDKIKSHMEFSDQKTGLRAESILMREANGLGVDQFRANFHILDSAGNKVGDAERIFQIDSEGVPFVLHEYIKLKKNVRGAGFAKRWNSNNEALYRELGFKEIRLHANIDVGGYAWAKQGYDFRGKPNDLLSKFTKALKEPQYAAVREDGMSLVERARSGDLPLPLEFAMLGWTAGAETWPGKEIMLGSSWNGVKKL